MITLQKLTSQNIDEFKKIYIKSRLSENYDRDFFKLYEEQNFVVKFLFKRFLRLFVYNSDIIGFMWYETPIDINVRIWALYIDDMCIDLLSGNLLSNFNSSILSYEAVDTTRNINTLKNLGFKEVRPTVFMNLQIANYNTMSVNYSKDIIKFRKFKIGEDEKTRCKLQNDIFADFNRTPITIEDVYSDLNQDYYINDLAIFIVVNNNIIGYGQIVFNRDMYTVVNFGILSDHRGNGYGKLLLNKLITISKERAIKNLYIRVDENNFKAIRLYESAGFKEKYMISRWDR